MTGRCLFVVLDDDATRETIVVGVYTRLSFAEAAMSFADAVQQARVRLQPVVVDRPLLGPA